MSHLNRPVWHKNVSNAFTIILFKFTCIFRYFVFCKAGFKWTKFRCFLFFFFYTYVCYYKTLKKIWRLDNRINNTVIYLGAFSDFCFVIYDKHHLCISQIFMWNYLQGKFLFLSGLFTVTVKIMSPCLAVFLAFFYFVCIKYSYSRHQRNFLKSLKHLLNVSSSSERKGAGIRALVVTAHPDDECMFFAPAIIQLVSLNVDVHLLCLSQGMATKFSHAHI